MKKIELGQAIGILANLGVIAGIIFLAVELQQNNSLLETQIRSNFMGARFQVNNVITENAWLPEIFAKIELGEALSLDEEMRLQAQHQNILTIAQWMYQDFTALGLEPDGERFRATFCGQTLTPRISETWEKYRLSAQLDFVQWMDEAVTECGD